MRCLSCRVWTNSNEWTKLPPGWRCPHSGAVDSSHLQRVGCEAVSCFDTSELRQAFIAIDAEIEDAA